VCWPRLDIVVNTLYMLTSLSAAAVTFIKEPTKKIVGGNIVHERNREVVYRVESSFCASWKMGHFQPR